MRGRRVVLPLRRSRLSCLRHRVDRAARRRHGAPGGPRKLRLRPGAVYGFRVRTRHRARGPAALRDPRYPHARRRRRASAGAVPGGRMRIVWSWLREFCPTEHTAEALAERLTLHGVKVEEVLRPW